MRLGGRFFENMPDREKIGKKIAEKRIEAGLTQSELGKRLGISQSHVARIENGLYDARFCVSVKIAEAIGCSIDDFMKEPSS